MGKSTLGYALRLVSVILLLVSSILMFVSKQKVETYSITFVARDTDWAGLLFCAIVSICVCSYNLFAVFIPSNSPLWKPIMFLDMIICILMSASLGVGWQTYSLLVEGNRNSIYANWSPVCHIVPSFCKQIFISMVLFSIGFVSSFLLLAICIFVSVDVTLTRINNA